MTLKKQDLQPSMTILIQTAILAIISITNTQGINLTAIINHYSKATMFTAQIPQEFLQRSQKTIVSRAN